MKRVYIFIFLSTLIYGSIVDIKANYFHANNILKVAYFEGNAKIKEGVNSLSADKIVVYFNNKRKATKYEAIGKVKFDLVENGVHYVGKADKIRYSPNSSKYYFYGAVLLKDLTNNRKIEANSISLDLKTGLADIKGGNKKPVHFIFEIEDRK